MTDTKYDLFRNNICNAVTSSVYKGWEANDLSNLSNSDRTIYYDGNIAFTSGDKSIVSTTSGDGSLLAVPDLYGTLKGLNERINTVNDRIGGIQEGEISTADSLLYVNSSSSNAFVISPGNGNNETIAGNIASNPAASSISLQAGSNKPKFTVNGDNFLFTVNGKTLSLTDLLKMIEELRARTAPIKTNVTRNHVTGSPYFPYNSTTFGVNTVEQE